MGKYYQLWWYQHTNGSIRHWKLWQFLAIRILAISATGGLFYLFVPTLILFLLKAIVLIAAAIGAVYLLKWVKDEITWRFQQRQKIVSTVQYRRK